MEIPYESLCYTHWGAFADWAVENDHKAARFAGRVSRALEKLHHNGTDPRCFLAVPCRNLNTGEVVLSVIALRNQWGWLSEISKHAVTVHPHLLTGQFPRELHHREMRWTWWPPWVRLNHRAFWLTPKQFRKIPFTNVSPVPYPLWPGDPLVRQWWLPWHPLRKKFYRAVIQRATGIKE